MFPVSSCSCLCPIQWSQALSREWRCSWSSADRRCSNYIWVIDNFIAYYSASYIRDFAVIHIDKRVSCGWRLLKFCSLISALWIFLIMYLLALNHIHAILQCTQILHKMYYHFPCRAWNMQDKLEHNQPCLLMPSFFVSPSHQHGQQV